MVRIEKRKIALMISLGIALMLLCIAVVFVIDTHFSLDPWGDGDVEVLWYFLVGSIFFPGALRRYRAGRQGERKVPWYHRLDLILCLIGLVFGPVFALSVVQKQVDSVLMSYNSPGVGEGSLTALAIAVTTVDLCWIALFLLFLYQGVKQNLQRKKDPPPTI